MNYLGIKTCYTCQNASKLPYVKVTTATNKSLKNRRSKIFDGTPDQPLPGASIVVKNQPTRGTATAADGSFSIMAADDEILRISYIGFKTVEIPAKDLPAGVGLKEDMQQLSDVVVTATRPQKEVITQPSLNDKIKKNKDIIIILLMAVGLGLSYYGLRKNTAKPTKK